MSCIPDKKRKREEDQEDDSTTNKNYKYEHLPHISMAALSLDELDDQRPRKRIKSERIAEEDDRVYVFDESVEDLNYKEAIELVYTKSDLFRLPEILDRFYTLDSFVGIAEEAMMERDYSDGEPLETAVLHFVLDKICHTLRGDRFKKVVENQDVYPTSERVIIGIAAIRRYCPSGLEYLIRKQFLNETTVKEILDFFKKEDRNAYLDVLEWFNNTMSRFIM